MSLARSSRLSWLGWCGGWWGLLSRWCSCKHDYRVVRVDKESCVFYIFSYSISIVVKVRGAYGRHVTFSQCSSIAPSPPWRSVHRHRHPESSDGSSWLGFGNSVVVLGLLLRTVSTQCTPERLRSVFLWPTGECQSFHAKSLINMAAHWRNWTWVTTTSDILFSGDLFSFNFLNHYLCIVLVAHVGGNAKSFSWLYDSTEVFMMQSIVVASIVWGMIMMRHLMFPLGISSGNIRSININKASSHFCL